MDTPNKTVILNINENTLPWHFFSYQCTPIILESETKVLCLFCSEIDIEHPTYLKVVAHKRIADNHEPTFQEGVTTQIPHHLILSIVHNVAAEKNIGFLAGAI